MRSLFLNHITHKPAAIALLALIAVLYSFSIGLLLVTDAQAYVSEICTSGSAECLTKEVGPFMSGISAACGNSGDCELSDIMRVFINTGNYVVGIIGAVVLLMYIIGGIYMLTSGGAQDRVTKGKKYITISTTGLLIVMFSYLGIQLLNNVLRGGEEALDDYALCEPVEAGEDKSETAGDTCGYNQKCSDEGTCLTICELNGISIGETTSCVDSESDPNFGSYSACSSNMCPGADNIVCCVIE
jgi:hypothetical protein